MLDGVKHVLLIFVDGIGVGSADPSINPFAAAPCRVFKITEKHPPRLPRNGWFKAVDASLGLPGLPQSATGQTAILTGLNASQIRGGHLRGYPDETLKGLLREHSILGQAANAGLKVVFANAYRTAFFTYGHLAPHSVTTVAALEAGLSLKSVEDLKAKKALYQEFTNRALIKMGEDAPEWTPAQAGRVLGGIVAEHNFTLYEYFQSDKAGHSGGRERAIREVRQLDEFVDALLEEVDLDSALVALTSDHGNLEDLSSRDHTHNPAPLMAWGKGAERVFEKAESILDIAPILRDILALSSEKEVSAA